MASEVGAAWNSTFCFIAILCYIVGWSIGNNVFQIIAIVCCGITFMCFDGLTLQEHIVCDDETTIERTKRDNYNGVEPLQLGD